MSTDTQTEGRKAPGTVRKLRGPTKAAITFLCLGEEAGSALMQKLSSAEIERVTMAMSRLGPIPASIVEDVLSEFTEGVISGSSSVVGSISAAEVDAAQVPAGRSGRDDHQERSQQYPRDRDLAQPRRIERDRHRELSER